METLLVILMLLFAADSDKRIILHNAADMAQELLAIRSELESFKANTSQHISRLENENTDLHNKISSLEREVNKSGGENTYLHNKISSLESEVNKSGGENTDLHNKISSLERVLKAFGEFGSIFVRWGRTVCPGNSSQSIYKGYTSGGTFSDRGGGSSDLCLPDNPTWGNYSLGVDGWKGYIYGVEIDIMEPSHIFPHPVHNQDKPFVVCSSKYQVTHMFPGRVNCYPGWAGLFNFLDI